MMISIKAAKLEHLVHPMVHSFLHILLLHNLFHVATLNLQLRSHHASGICLVAYTTMDWGVAVPSGAMHFCAVLLNVKSRDSAITAYTALCQLYLRRRAENWAIPC